ncbi:hypothetical protein [Streptomyces sp. 5-6(2022)]|uniref:hypothetical protein n=1 Tax=Streptomyces sp. 5-6(2022) TaxID=2936510 RepID=UPI0023B8EA61|nr:hypothetical protein [Streptomyces sp. 5-6(2022)]
MAAATRCPAPHHNPTKAADGKRLHGPEPDPETAPIMVRIFTEYLRRTGLYAVAEGLTRDNHPLPRAQASITTGFVGTLVI